MTGFTWAEAFQQWLTWLRSDAEQRATKNRQRQALDALTRLVSDFPELSHFGDCLSDVKASLQAQLDNAREYREMRLIDRITSDISELMALRNERREAPQVPSPGFGNSAMATPHWMSPRITPEPVQADPMPAAMPVPPLREAEAAAPTPFHAGPDAARSNGPSSDFSWPHQMGEGFRSAGERPLFGTQFGEYSNAAATRAFDLARGLQRGAGLAGQNDSGNTDDDQHRINGGDPLRPAV